MTSIGQNYQDPNVFAQQYAQENNISVAEAKNQLEKIYGVPQQPSIFQNSDNSNNATNLFSTGDLSNIYSAAGEEGISEISQGLTEAITNLINALTNFLNSFMNNKDEAEDEDENSLTNVTTTDSAKTENTDESKNTDSGKKTSSSKKNSSDSTSSSGSKNEAKTNQPNAQQADNTVKEYARHHHCTEAEAREALKNEFGNPAGYEGA